MLSIEELLELEESLKEELEENLEGILVRLNRTGELESLLQILGLESLLGHNPYMHSENKGKIVVIGKSEVEENKLIAIAKNLGIEKERFEFYLDYEDAKKFNFKKMQYAPGYSMILVGQMPHSGSAKGEYSSVISAIEHEEGYPPVVRLGVNGLKITKTSFRNTLEELLAEKKIA